MDRVNRSLLIASALLAIPAALITASLVNGTTPDARPAEVQHAVGTAPEGDVGHVQQVVGKQIETRRSTRPGLFEVLSGNQPKGNANHQHHNMPESKPRGLLDGLFNRASRGSSQSRTSQPTRARSVARPSQTNHQHHHGSNHSAASSSRSSRATGSDWDGIPYHNPTHSARQGNAIPISDPEGNSVVSTAKTRIIRGGNRASIPASTASVRAPSQPTLAKSPRSADQTGAPSRATRRIPAAPSSTRSLSTNQSSRRSGRSLSGSRDQSELTAAGREAAERGAAGRGFETVDSKTTLTPDPAEDEDLSDVVDLVPKVSKHRKPIQRNSDPSQERVAKSHADQPESDQVATGPASTPTQTRPSATKQGVIESGSALAAIGRPAPNPAPTERERSPSDSQPNQPVTAPSVAESLPSESRSPQSPGYATPDSTTPAPVPVAGIPSHPYAASVPSTQSQNQTPASPVSHRAGPPQSAFASDRGATSSTAGQTHINAASTPVIGSGVMPKGDVASYRRPASVPQQDSAIQSASPQRQAAEVPHRMSTNGQPAGSNNSAPFANAPDANAGSVAGNDTVAPIPMSPIAGHSAANSAGTATTPGRGLAGADGFAATNPVSRNQMRSGDQAGASAIASELPGIRVVTRGPSSIMIRQTNQYEIRVENRGSIDATGVLVRAIVPDWADVHGRNATRGVIDNEVQGKTERLVWTIDHLPAGASEQMFVRLTAARSGTYSLDVDWTLLPQKSVATVQVHEPRLDLTIDGPDEVVFGQSQTYKVRVLNPGDGTAPNVVFTLSPNSATPQTQRIGDIPAGKEAQFDVELTAQDLGDLKIHGLAAGDLELRAEAVKTIRVASAKLEAVLSGPELKYQNTDATYNLQLHNTGRATSERIVATLHLPSGTKYLGGIDDAVIEGNVLRWTVNTLAPGASRDYQFRCKMAATGEHVFAFDCSGSAAGRTDVAISTKVESIDDLVLSISDPPAPAPVGKDVTYEIVIRNRGSREANDVRVIAQFSHGIEPQRIEGQSGEVVTGQVLFDSIPRIGAGQQVQLRVVAQAEQAGHHRFRAEVRSGDTVLVAEEATHYMSPVSERISRRSGQGDSR